MAWGARSRGLLVVAIAVVLLLLAIPLPLPREGDIVRGPSLDLDAASAARPETGHRLLFIHHSCGGQWLADEGPNDGHGSIYVTARNGGGLRRRLEAEGYEVHEASYGSRIGSRTDVFDWPPTFLERMDEVLRCDRQDRLYPDGARNRIVMFKSCFPNSRFVARGTPPGSETGPALTVENAKAAYRALLPAFASEPDTLFVAVTAPPLVRRRASLGVRWLKRLLGRPSLERSGPLAREFNNWLKDPHAGWLASYPGRNVVVFDLFDVLTGHGTSNFSRFGSGADGRDDHPSAAGNRLATEAFVPFLNRAVHRAGIAAPSGESSMTTEQDS